MRWRWWRRRGATDAQQARADAEAQLEAAKEQAPEVEQAAHRVADMPSDELAALVAEAFSRRRA